MPSEEKELKSRCYNIIKVITILLVVIAHVLRMYYTDGAFKPLLQSRWLGYLSLFIYTFHMPLFILISGCVYGWCLQAGKYGDTGAFLRGKVLRILVPYLFFGLFWAAPVMELCSLTQQSYPAYCWHGIILSMNPRHLWYLLALFWIYVLAGGMRPLIIKYDKPWYLLVSAALFYLYLRLPGTNFLQLVPALRYQLFFFAGVAINRYFGAAIKAVEKARWPIFVLCPLILVASVKYDPNPDWKMKLVFAFIGIVWLMSIGTALSMYCGERVESGALYRIISRDSFGIYLFHPMIIYIIFWLLGGMRISPLLLSLFAFAVSTTVSVGLTELFRKCGLGLLIGEKKC